MARGHFKSVSVHFPALFRMQSSSCTRLNLTDSYSWMTVAPPLFPSYSPQTALCHQFLDIILQSLSEGICLVRPGILINAPCVQDMHLRCYSAGPDKLIIAP